MLEHTLSHAGQEQGARSRSPTSRRETRIAAEFGFLEQVWRGSSNELEHEALTPRRRKLAGLEGGLPASQRTS